MNAENRAATPGVNPVPIFLTPSAEAAAKLYEREIAAYLRELPRLLEEGEAGRHALVKGDEVLSVWDTQRDAIQAGVERFGPTEPIFIRTIDPRDPERYALLEEWKKTQCRP